ncbi:MAG: hypothetical protein MNPFHGCM_00208 [Gemmatimonadaceae bacterium]|nr:hypothetical protein [Gemmatimonadaceae bacterium]
MSMRYVKRWSRRVSLGCALSALVQGQAVWAQQTKEPDGLKVTAQVAAGTVMAPVAFVVGGLTTKWVARHLGATEARERSLAYVGAWILAGAATAAAPALLEKGGYFMASAAGAAIGGSVAAVMVAGGRALFRNDDRCGVFCTAWGLATFAVPATGAAVVYNRSR